MSNYVKATDFASKDALLTGNPAKIIKGTEIDDEYNAIAVAVNTKADLVSPTFTGTPLAPTATPGTTTTQVATTAFAATAATNAANASFPIGGIIMWSGSIGTIPAKWQLCDGTNGTPDLRNRFIVGAGSTYAVNATGGSADAITVSHTHTATSTVTDPGHNHLLTNAYGDVNGAATEWRIRGQTSTSNTPNVTTDTKTTGVTVATSVASTGSSGTNANLPPYFALAYIMRVTA
jgi:microcystin-dependent protein